MGRPLKAKPSCVKYPASTPGPIETVGLTSASVEEPQLTALMWKVSETFRRFAKKARKLSRMTSKSGGPVSSEGYNYLFQEQIRELNRTFSAYMSSREEMRCYVHSTYWRSKYYDHGLNFALKSERHSQEKMRQSFRTAS